MDINALVDVLRLFRATPEEVLAAVERLRLEATRTPILILPPLAHE